MAFAMSSQLTIGSALTGTSLKARATPRIAGRGPCVVQNAIAPEKRVVPDDVLSYAKSLPGISAPFPQTFDPLNLLSNAASTANGINEVKRWRESEITHGRVAMLASLGFIAQEQILGSKAPRPFPHVEGAAIGHFQQVETQGAIFWLPLLLVIALAESYRVSVGWSNPTQGKLQKLEDDYAPGDLGFDPLGLLPDDPKERYDLQTKELNNGRLAMIAIAAFVAQELRTQKPIFENLNLTGARTPA